MSRDSIDVMTSPSAEAIRTYCHELAQELEITLVDGSVAKFDFWTKSKNFVSGIQ
jgi:hypothetical protein